MKEKWQIVRRNRGRAEKKLLTHLQNCKVCNQNTLCSKGLNINQRYQTWIEQADQNPRPV